jgi:cytochrome c2
VPLAVRLFVACPLLFVPFVAHADQSGEAVFKRNCAICHSTEPDHNRVGPSLAGVVGRHSGAVPNFVYSSANKNSGIVWTQDKLDAYLANPQGVVPGTTMLFPGVKNDADRHALIDFLATLSGS